jgi:hypothetical protein
MGKIFGSCSNYQKGANPVVSSSAQELTPKTTTTSKAAIVFAFMYFIISVKKLKKTPCLRQTRHFKI